MPSLTVDPTSPRRHCRFKAPSGARFPRVAAVPPPHPGGVVTDQCNQWALILSMASPGRDRGGGATMAYPGQVRDGDRNRDGDQEWRRGIGTGTGTETGTETESGTGNRTGTGNGIGTGGLGAAAGSPTRTGRRGLGTEEAAGSGTGERDRNPERRRGPGTMIGTVTRTGTLTRGLDRTRGWSGDGGQGRRAEGPGRVTPGLSPCPFRCPVPGSHRLCPLPRASPAQDTPPRLAPTPGVPTAGGHPQDPTGNLRREVPTEVPTAAPSPGPTAGRPREVSPGVSRGRGGERWGP